MITHEYLLEKLDERDREALRRVYQKMLVKGLSINTINKTIYEAYKFSLFLKNRNKSLESATPEDLEDYTIHVLTVEKRTRYSSKIAIQTLKTMYTLYLKRKEFREVEIPREKVEKHIIWRSEEIESLFKYCKNDYERALLAVLWETGCRVGELQSIKIRDVTFTGYGAKIIVTGKTGERPLPVIQYSSYLWSFFEHHPFKDRPEAFFFHGHTPQSRYPIPHKPIEQQSVNRILRRLARKAGIKKRISSHIIRRSRATYLARKLTERELMLFMGWTSPRVVGIYVKLSMRDIENKMLQIYGLKKREDEEKVNKCPRCGFINSPNIMFCGRCGRPLTPEAEIRTLTNVLRGDKQVVQEILKRLSEDADSIKKILEIIYR